jgi:hypothetical protein
MVVLFFPLSLSKKKKKPQTLLYPSLVTETRQGNSRAMQEGRGQEKTWKEQNTNLPLELLEPTSL